MGAVVNAGNFNALPVQKGEHPVVQGQDVRLPIKTAGDAGLICNDDQKVAQPPKHSQGIDHTWQKNEVRPAMNVTAILVEDSVTVEKNSGISPHDCAPMACNREMMDVVL